MNIQAKPVDNYCFIDVLIKWPGSAHGARVFSTSNLFESLRNGTIRQCRKIAVNGQPEVLICILGDPAYPLLLYLMKDFGNRAKDQREKIFGYRLSSALKQGTWLIKEILKWSQPCKCVILLVSRIFWHKRINPSLKEWRFWYLILTGHFLP